MRTGFSFFAMVMVLLSIFPAQARDVRFWLPEELEPKADLIFNGSVVSIRQMKPAGEPSVPGAKGGDEVMMEARIKMLHVFKGNASSEILFRYPQSNRFMPGALLHVSLKSGQRYRFFLNSGKEGEPYLGVLAKDGDDCFEVQKLLPDEPDQSPFLTKKEVIPLVRKFLAGKKGLTLPDDQEFSYWAGDYDPSWQVSFPEGSDIPGVTVSGDRSVRLSPKLED